MAKRKHQDHNEDEHIDETWLIPYADLLTLLLALFIVLFSMRTEDQTKANAMLESLYKAFNSISVFESNSGGQTPSDTTLTDNETKPDIIPSPKEKLKNKEDEQKLQQLMAKLQKYIDQKKLNAYISLTDLEKGIQITLKNSIVFDSGSDQLKTDFIPILNNISGLLKTVDHSIIIVGHTDNQPINTAQFTSNWELSGARALSVLKYFQNKNIDPNRLSYTGYGEFKPIKPNDTPENREANRRVNIIILRK